MLGIVLAESQSAGDIHVAVVVEGTGISGCIQAETYLVYGFLFTPEYDKGKSARIFPIYDSMRSFI